MCWKINYKWIKYKWQSFIFWTVYDMRIAMQDWKKLIVVAKLIKVNWAYPWLTESLSACIGLVILSLSSCDHLRAPATRGMFLFIGGVPSSFAVIICWSNMILASSSSSSYIFSRMGYLYSKSEWISGRSSKEPKQSRSYKVWKGFKMFSFVWSWKFKCDAY